MRGTMCPDLDTSMLTHPQIDPVALSLGTFDIPGIGLVGPVNIHWYGITYLIAFALCWAALRIRASDARNYWTPELVSDLVFYVALGAVLGGRVGYVLFYGFSGFIENPIVLFQVWNGGMSFHGGLLGSILAIALYARKIDQSFASVADSVAVVIPLGLGAGRLGNFINAELWGRSTDLPWGMVFPGAGPDPRHPSQLYQFALEGLALFAILWVFSARAPPPLATGGLFLLGYGAFRFCVEFVREPDPHLGFVAFDWMTMGQVLSLPMLAFGAGLIFLAYRRQPVTL